MALMTTTRTHFTFRVDTWTPDGENIVEHVAGGLHSLPTARRVNVGPARPSACGKVRE
jgi:hypothetical protein